MDYDSLMSMSRKSSYMAILSVALVLTLACPTKGASPKVCSKKDSTFALDEAGSLKNWNAVYRSFKRFAHCDDGAIGEGYSDTIGRLLASDWRHFDSLYSLTVADPSFKRFVLRHIDETLSDEELKSILANAKLQCPSGRAALCGQIAANAAQSNK